jgi:CheY-like chemotaxis protein
VYSEVGTGTTFKIYLPQVDQVAETPAAQATEPTSLHGSEAILVVEDSTQLRTLIREVLELYGYRVLDAPSGAAALEVVSQPGTHVDLLLTDVIMPGMNGRELADTLTAKQPGLKVVFASGYTADALTRYGVEQGSGYLQKPFSPKVLAMKVREVLDSRPSSRP